MSRLAPLDRVARIDADIASLRARLDAKLTERRVLLATLIADGEAQRADVADEIRALTHANNVVATGRVLTDDQVREIRRLHAEGHSQSALGRRFGLAQPSIYKIVRRRSYADVA
jgi:hypothetical protein